MSSTEQDVTANPLLARLADRIRRQGPLPVDAYMHACMADPDHGYWRRTETIGAGGDFTTSPEISQVFGELIGLWAAVTAQQMGSPAGLQLIELGPGRGTLMRDALRAAHRVPAFVEGLTVHLVEISQALRDRQRAMLETVPQSVPVAWHANVADVPEGPAILIANEFLDALPIRQFVRGAEQWHERVVTVNEADGTLRFALGDAFHMPGAPDAAPGAVIEQRPCEGDLLAVLARRASPLVALFMDYGPSDATVGDTLQAVRRHTYADPLAEPGMADLTAHVLFASLAEKACAAGLVAAGPVTQAEFLGRLGIVQRAARLMSANPDRASEIEAGVQRLMSPGGMGQLFKVLAVRSPGLPPPEPFG